MYKIIFAPGCYGHFLAVCLNRYSNKINLSEVEFTHTGNSHIVRSKNPLRLEISHIDNTIVDDSSILLVPNKDYYLDYFDNQFAKHHNYNLNRTLSAVFGNEYQTKIQNYWHNSNKHPTTWMIREFLSFCLHDVFTVGFMPYITERNGLKVQTTHLFEHLYDTLNYISSSTGIKLYLDRQDINITQKQFSLAQKFHKIQFRCIVWTNDIINNKNNPNPCLTIFDEAYVQYLLRDLGYSLKCNNLHILPNSKKMHQLIHAN
jgi:hypothetical protein